MKRLTSYQVELVDVLIESKALAFGSFTLKSGKVSPYFFNMGRAVSMGGYLAKISRCYAEKMLDTIGEDFSFIFGPAYKGIPLACSIAQTLSSAYGIDRRWGYDRKETKEYGDTRDKVLVGEVMDGDRIVMIDDVVTTGGTKVEAWEKISGLAKDVVSKGVFVAVDRQERDKDGNRPEDVLKRDGLELFSIITATQMFDHLLNREIEGKILVDEDIYQSFREYREKY
ncbi:MAG TPA: orotate phosphoribosyltransferase [Candidatus Methanofastidiosa archaeon]|nr:orotate phosphoribosyltransferase [Candidatus Methanofastidiosa archaeon]